MRTRSPSRDGIARILSQGSIRTAEEEEEKAAAAAW
jgi:hypothetical protein